MKYIVVFDVTQAGFKDWHFSAFGLIFVVIGTGMLIYRWKNPAKDSTFRTRFFPYVFTAFAVLWTATSFWATFSDYRHLRDALLNGKYTIVEGTVMDFVPMPYSGHAMEKFNVAGHHYEYSDYNVVAGFNNTQSHGGTIRQGLRVRIADVDGQIARLEIAEESVAQSIGLGDRDAQNKKYENDENTSHQPTSGFVFKNFNIIFAISFFWVGIIIVASIIYKVKSGKKLKPIDLGEILYQENGVSGSSHKSILTRLGGARNCLLVTATKNEIDIHPSFPFNLMFLPEIYDLKHRIAVKDIKIIQRVEHVIGKSSIKIEYLQNGRESKAVELYLGNADKFLASIGRNAV